MIKIIKEGRFKKKVCDDCDCEFLYGDEDVVEVTNPLLTKCKSHTICCPCCGKTIYLPPINLNNPLLLTK